MALGRQCSVCGSYCCQSRKWYTKCKYFGDRAIHIFAQCSTVEVRNFLRLPVEIQKFITRQFHDDANLDWNFNEIGDNVEISADASAYFADSGRQIENLNLFCLFWPVSAPRITLDLLMADWDLEDAAVFPEASQWLNDFAGNLCHQKVVYDYSRLFRGCPLKTPEVT